jgi:hypothetical protein
LAIPAPAEYLMTTRVYVTSPSAAEIFCRLERDTEGGGTDLWGYQPLAANAPTVVLDETQFAINREIRLFCGGTRDVDFSISKIELLAKRLP